MITDTFKADDRIFTIDDLNEAARDSGIDYALEIEKEDFQFQEKVVSFACRYFTMSSEDLRARIEGDLYSLSDYLDSSSLVAVRQSEIFRASGKSEEEVKAFIDLTASLSADTIRTLYSRATGTKI